ncbi:dehydrogenase [Streptomyces sp. NPDC006529]|uniref:dehydrogenase n=1 Tax=Streptomyces sp. NPDC006529 TaxID=3157177 RepID=UPI0033A27AC5
MTSNEPTCPECSRVMEFGGFVLCRRKDDDKRVCRGVWKCPAPHVWWNWADRPHETLERCPMPDMFR